VSSITEIACGRCHCLWGAYGYASEFGWNYKRILAHYYGGTTLARLSSPEPEVTVELSELQGKTTAVVDAGGAALWASWQGRPEARAVAFEVARKDGAMVVSSGASCSRPWHRVARLDLPAEGVTLSPPPATSSPSSLLQVCLSGGGPRTCQGRLIVRPYGATYNVVGLEDYVDGVVPAESPASWAEAGGEAALEAQAVAARSYAVATMESVGHICDTAACQVYTGLPQQYGLTADAAVAATTGVVLHCDAGSSCGPAGSVAMAEYSASTGGYSAGGAFPAVPDLGDSLAGNPVHLWSLKVPLAALDRHFGSLGAPLSVDVVKRNGLGALGGRALLLVIRGEHGSLLLSGTRFAAALGLPSDWFSVEAPPTTPGKLPPSSATRTPPASTSTTPAGTTITTTPEAATTTPAED
jgi:peptidoglycan hydrolase-like amidase